MLDHILVLNNTSRTIIHQVQYSSLCFALILAVCAAAYAQGEAKPSLTVAERGPSTSGSAKDGSTKQKSIRARRVATQPTAAQPVTAQPVSTTAAHNETSIRDDIEINKLRAEIKAAGADGERARLQRLLIDRLVETNRKSEAIDELHTMARDERFDPAGFYNVGNALARLGDSNAAVEAYRKAINQRHGNYSHALNNLGVVLMRLGRLDEAYQALTAAIKQENFTYAEASYNLGRLYTLRGEPGLAIREWSRAIYLQPDHADATTALARAYAEGGNSERGLAIIDAFVARSSRNGTAVPSSIAQARREIVEASSLGNIRQKAAAASSTTQNPTPKQ